MDKQGKIYRIGRKDWVYAIFDIPLDNQRNHTAKAVITSSLEDARQTYTSMASKGIDRFVWMGHVSPALAGQLQQMMDIEKVVTAIQSAKGEYEMVSCNKAKEAVMQL